MKLPCAIIHVAQICAIVVEGPEQIRLHDHMFAGPEAREWVLSVVCIYPGVCNYFWGLV